MNSSALDVYWDALMWIPAGNFNGPFSIILRILNENQPDDDSKVSVLCKSIIYNYILLSFIFFLKLFLSRTNGWISKPSVAFGNRIFCSPPRPLARDQVKRVVWTFCCAVVKGLVSARGACAFNSFLAKVNAERQKLGSRQHSTFGQDFWREWVARARAAKQPGQPALPRRR